MFSTGDGRVDGYRQVMPAGESPGDHQQSAHLRSQESQGKCKSLGASEDCISVAPFSETQVCRASAARRLDCAGRLGYWERHQCPS